MTRQEVQVSTLQKLYGKKIDTIIFDESHTFTEAQLAKLYGFLPELPHNLGKTLQGNPYEN
jgi:hypothetical protein